MKRIISVLMVVMLAMFTAACASAEETAQLTAESGKITVTNAVGNGTLILAFYDDGVLVGTSTHQGSGTITADISNVPEGTDKAKAFYWDMENITPLGNTIPIPLNNESPESTDNPIEEATGEPTEEEENTSEMKMNVQIGNKSFTATLEDNAAARELVEMMREAPVSINMNDYGSFEKVGSLGRSLTTDNHQITTTEGDIVLYQGNQIVMFYGSNSWSYTKIGRIDDLTDWKEALGSGDITAVFSIKE